MQIQVSSKAILYRVLHRTKKSFLCAAIILFSLFSVVVPAIAQIEPPILESAKDSSLMQAALSPLAWPQPQPPMPDLPAQVAIPANQPIPVTLDTPLSTVNSKQGQIVIFRTRYSMPLGDGLELPPQTQILGHVVEVIRPAHFGREGELRLAVDRIRLNPDTNATLAAHLDSDEMKGPGRFTIDAPHSTDLHPVAMDSAAGALLGAVSGATGAAIGAGTSAALAVLILKSPRGQDVYLEQGMRFAVTLDQPAYLDGVAIYAAQQEFKKQPRPSSLEPDSQNGSLPQLKRRRAGPN